MVPSGEGDGGLPEGPCPGIGFGAELSGFQGTIWYLVNCPLLLLRDPREEMDLPAILVAEPGMDLSPADAERASVASRSWV